jgi:uncharacterized membrane protein YdjX (TVP38/TMEM64 family)
MTVRHVLLFQAALAITELPYAIATVFLGESLHKGESSLFILPGVVVILSGAFLLLIFRKMGHRSGASSF